MEKLLVLRQEASGSPAFIKNVDRKADSTYTHLPNNYLMELIKQIKKGKIQARETLSAQYIKLVINICNDFKGNGITDLELILKGNAGLIKAAENYDEERGIDFRAYATWSVRQEIIRAIDEKELSKPVPLNQIGILTKKKYWSPIPMERVENSL